jgi:hypothetical protein
MPGLCQIISAMRAVSGHFKAGGYSHRCKSTSRDVRLITAARGAKITNRSVSPNAAKKGCNQGILAQLARSLRFIMSEAPRPAGA